MTRTKFASLMTTPTKTPARRVISKNSNVEETAIATRRRRGGRSSNPQDFKQMLIYVDRPTYDAFKVALAQEQRQASDVIPKLMQLWLASPRNKHLDI